MTLEHIGVLIKYQPVGTGNRPKKNSLTNFPDSIRESRTSLAALLVRTTDELLVIEARSFLDNDLWISCDHMADSEATLLTTLVYEGPTLFPLFTSDLLHF